MQAFTVLPFTRWPVALDMQGTNKQGAAESTGLENLHFTDSNLNVKVFYLNFRIISVYVYHTVLHLYLHSMLKSYFRQRVSEGTGFVCIQLCRGL